MPDNCSLSKCSLAFELIQPVTRSSGDRSAGGRVVRGGSWNNNHDNARVANRNHNNPDNSNNNIGCRGVAHDFLTPAGNALC